LNSPGRQPRVSCLPPIPNPEGVAEIARSVALSGLEGEDGLSTRGWHPGLFNRRPFRAGGQCQGAVQNSTPKLTAVSPGRPPPRPLRPGRRSVGDSAPETGGPSREVETRPPSPQLRSARRWRLLLDPGRHADGGGRSGCGPRGSPLEPVVSSVTPY
jgi:hypothetical protein